MKLRALDQIAISAVKADVIAADEEFDVTDEHGEQLLEKHPNTLVRVAEAPAAKPAPKPKNKVEPPSRAPAKPKAKSKA